MNKAVVGVFAIIVLAAAASGCRQTDKRVHKIWTPGLKNQQCADIVQKAIERYSTLPSMEDSIATNKITFNFDERSVIVEFESMKLSHKNIEHVIAAAGFAANDVPADTNAAAKLPPECR